jgi:hypothetical protein
VLGPIEDTLLTEEEMERQDQENRQLLDAFGGSAQKRATEDTIRDESPTQARFDTSLELLNKPLSTATNQQDSRVECLLNPKQETISRIESAV